MIRSYFDYNATAPIRAEIGGMMQALLLMPLNVSSIHAEGRRARSLLETARRGIAEHIGVFPAEVIFIKADFMHIFAELKQKGKTPNLIE